MVATKNKPVQVLHFAGPNSSKNLRISDSLIAVAGDLAPVLALLDEFPHSKILGKSRAHLHLIALTYVRAKSLDHAKLVFDQDGFANACEIAFGERINGLEGILRRCPASLFAADAYKLFRKIIRDSNAQKVFRHSDSIAAELIETLYNLPPELRMAGVVNKLRHPDEALIIQLACNDAKNPAGMADRKRLAERLGQIRSTEKFWEALTDELVGQLGPIPTPPPIDHPNFYPVTSLKQVIKVAKKFRNCLRNYLSEVKRGEMALHIFARGEESAVIGIAPAFGCAGMVKEIKGPENERIRPDLYEEVIDILHRNGFEIYMRHRHRDLDDIPRGLENLADYSEPHDIKKVSNQVIQSFLENL